jgi:predicted protein tyrosine phosphatase
MKLLFICSRNKRRSLTAEKIFTNVPGVEARSAGTQPGARIVVTEGLVGWADIIFAMEKSHLHKLRQKFGALLDARQVVALRIPDDYEFMQPELIDELQTQVGQYLSMDDSPGSS